MASLGGTSIREDILRLESTVHIIVATPGRILDLAEKEVVDLSTVKMVILDEVDKLLSTHFMPVTEQLFDFLSEDVQVLLFSATFPKETTKRFQSKYVPDPEFINLMVNNDLTLKGVTQYSYHKKNCTSPKKTGPLKNFGQFFHPPSETFQKRFSQYLGCF
jgi:ATP-dependent RNA helicase DDX6/DHH1